MFRRRTTGDDPTAPTQLTGEDLEKLRLAAALLGDDSRPNLNGLTEVVRNITMSNFNIKTLGYDLARRLAAALPADRRTVARHVGLQCKPSTQADMEDDWVAHWCGQLGIPVVFHRKLWELAYVLQAIFEHGHLREGARGLGFGCGVEPLPSYLAAHGVAVTVTDLEPDRAQTLGWTDTNQHAATLQSAFHAHLVSQDRFDALVDLRYVDMNAIPDDLGGYDFCWSVCALEHLGSIAQGLAFVRNALATLRPGGTAVHTTEYNIDPAGGTIDNWPTVLFQRRHFEALAAGLAAEGHEVAPLDFFPGDRPMDRFVDLPPFHHDLAPEMGRWLGEPLHLKVAVDGFASTCFGILVRKAA